MAKSSHSLHPIKLKLHVQLDHDVEQQVLFRGYSPPNISRVEPLWKCLLIFGFQLNPPTVYIRSSWNLICSKTMMWSSAYCFKVTVHQILAELNPFENFYFLFPAKSSYSLHPNKPKLHKYLHDDVEQHILFLGYSAPNICRFMPLWKFL